MNTEERKDKKFAKIGSYFAVGGFCIAVLGLLGLMITKDTFWMKVSFFGDGIMGIGALFYIYATILIKRDIARLLRMIDAQNIVLGELRNTTQNLRINKKVK